jgi:hypothetical protein
MFFWMINLVLKINLISNEFSIESQSTYLIVYKNTLSLIRHRGGEWKKNIAKSKVAMTNRQTRWNKLQKNGFEYYN